jgi:hypothetical protein
MSLASESLKPIPLAAAARLARATAIRLSVLALAALAACGGGSGTDTAPPMAIEEDSATVDSVPIVDGRLKAEATPAERQRAAQAAKPGFMPSGAPDAGTQGVFGPMLSWPLMPIHQVLLPDGRVLFYGSDITGQQGGGLHYAVWDPTLGTGEDAFLVLPNQAGTNIFCAGQTLLPDTGDALLIGGTVIVNGLRGIGVDDVNVFDVSGNTMVAQPKMSYRRWYPTLLSLADGQQLAMGGRMDPPGSGEDKAFLKRRAADPMAMPDGATFAITPELWNKTTGWHTLDGATSDDVFGHINENWYYPRAWVMPHGKVFILGNQGKMYMLNPDGAGKLTQLKSTVGTARALLQDVMYAPGKILSLRDNLAAVSIDINGKQPVVTTVPGSSRYRLYGNATLLADGQVWVNGGSADGNVLTNDFLVSEMWNPATNTWTDTASASIARLYHSTALLLPDATVITGGGGDPGPLKNLNGEIYYPPYLYLKDGSGHLAPRPSITSAPDVLGWGQSFKVEIQSATKISRVTLVRTGVVTHDFNSNQRFQELNFTQKKSELKLKTPASNGVAPPGFYMLFVIDANGVPSVAKIFRIGT